MLIQRSVIPALLTAVKITARLNQPEGEEMDEYQEELLEYRASELDPVEPADDATEL
ncbi:hypothetical protein V2K62_16885 [Pseudomonas alliivorans]|uniref:hypothetical protein n=1 Tax=Pseudomonas TaxID=286 RepID=UPI0017DCF5B8|nr:MULTISPECIES: hypothetical protein [Pseudomonas]MCO5364885.1 hypothetical protein [Pseudomonas alliivorans]MEE4307505.1 hypothetical protein [Pseudomonas alliivorans]MEE4325543.1 hypothetical protein [Pseudomonas alliivorans]MEE4332181.1 hypothetical protein [Pseudomonas alliivorans]MEE4344306.1 hypothetical protein [Pseudomonas alliivorans]